MKKLEVYKMRGEWKEEKGDTRGKGQEVRAKGTLEQDWKVEKKGMTGKENRSNRRHEDDNLAVGNTGGEAYIGVERDQEKGVGEISLGHSPLY